MRICGIICEYNPFHNGHAYLLEKARAESGCDAIVCVMSGNFTQRGEIAILDKYTRAEHAVRAGADAVLELPAVFALSPAELFAKGAVQLLCSIPAFRILAFGCESGGKAEFLSAAASASKPESNRFKEILHVCMQAGKSFLRARQEALAADGKTDLADMLSSPNNILGTEYTKALFSLGSNADILPVLRRGANYGDTQLQHAYSSASAIRIAVREGKQDRLVRKNVPDFVADDLNRCIDSDIYKKIALYAVMAATETTLRKAADCCEGLENRIKAVAASAPDYDELISKVTGKRYTAARIRRILAANVLGIEKGFAQKCMRSSMYLKPLAVKKDRANELLSALAQASAPLLVRHGDLSKTDKTAKEALRIDKHADGIFSLAAGKAMKGQTLFI